MEEGQRVTWRAINRDYSGVITGRHKLGFIVRIDNSDKSVIIHPKSFTNGDKTSR